MLEGKLVRLRAHAATDIDASLRWINDPEVTRTLAARYPMSRQSETAWLESVSTGGAVHRDHVAFAIDTREGRHIGNCGIESVSWENRSATAGILIGEKDCWDNGYGTDAMRTMLRFGFHEMNLHRIQLEVLAFNERGQAAYRKCGFAEEGRRRDAWYGDGAYHDVVIMGVLRSEFDALDAAATG